MLEQFLSVSLIEQFGWPTILGVCIIALITSAIHGATGVAGGFLMSAAIAPIIGVKPIVPVISVALLISHTTRALLNMKDFDRKAFLLVCLPSVPCIVIISSFYGDLSASLIAVFLGFVILSSIPVRRWAKSRHIKVGQKGLGSAGVVYGCLSGASIGPGMILVPFMLGYGLSKEAFVATLAAIALTTNITRVAVFGSTDIFIGGYFMLGICVGLATIPGNWFGRTILRRMSNDSHGRYVDILSILGALNFFWLAFRAF